MTTVPYSKKEKIHIKPNLLIGGSLMNTMANNAPLQHIMCYATYNPSVSNLTFPFHPTMEEFRRVSEYIPDLQDYYYVSNYGRVYNANTGYLVPPSMASSGYQFYVLRRKPESVTEGKYTTYTVSAQILVCTCFVGPKPGPEYQVFFKDLNKINNYYENLEWLTQDESNARANRDTTSTYFGSNAKYTEAQVRAVCEMLQQGIYDYNIISRKIFGIDANTQIQNFIYNVLNGDTWTSVSSEYHFDRNAKKRNFVPENILRGLFSFMQLYPAQAYTAPSAEVMRFIGIDPDTLDEQTRARYYGALSKIRNRPDSFREIRKDFNVPTNRNR